MVVSDRLGFRAVGDVKKKWTNIKDSFVKDVKGNKPRKSRGPPEHRKKYYLFDHLQFLIPFIQDSGESKKRARKPGPGEGSSRSLAAPPAPSAGAGKAVNSAAAASTAPRPGALPDVQRHADLLNDVAGKSAADALCQLDGDLSFMVSLLPTVKSMNEKQKIDFKIGVLQLLAGIKFNEVLQNPAPDVAAAYQPFATPPDLRCLAAVVPPFGQPHHVPFPFAQHRRQQHHRQHHRQSSSSTAKRNAAATTPSLPVKQETVVSSSPASSSTFENSDREEYDDVSDSNNN